MLITAILLVIIFALMVVLIALSKVDRTIMALIAGISAYFLICFLEDANFYTLVDLIVGTEADGYTNFQALILILGMMIIVAISVEGGLFQFLSFRLIQMTKGKPRYLLVAFCSLAVFITALLNDILTVILLIPLTITVCRILNINAVPYIVMQAMLVKLGASMLLISSIPNILIAAEVKISFLEFFLNVGIISIIVFGISLLFLLALFQNKLQLPTKGVDMLLEFNVWDFITNKSLMIKSIIVLVSVLVGFIIIPSELIPPDLIAISGAIILLLISGEDIKDIFKKIDFKLILYLIGVFIVVGSMDYVGVISFLGSAASQIATDDIFATAMMGLWISAAFSSCIDNVPVTRILLPTIDSLLVEFPRNQQLIVYAGMDYGINWGDNLTPVGDTLIAMNVAEQNKYPFKPVEFVRIAFPTVIIQLCSVSIIFALILKPLVGILLLSIAVGIILLILARNRSFSKKNARIFFQGISLKLKYKLQTFIEVIKNLKKYLFKRVSSTND